MNQASFQRDIKLWLKGSLTSGEILAALIERVGVANIERYVSQLESSTQKDLAKLAEAWDGTITTSVDESLLNEIDETALEHRQILWSEGINILKKSIAKNRTQQHM